MRRAETTALLAAQADALRSLGVGALYLFGSTARDEANSESDVDLFFDPSRSGLSLFDLMDVRDRLSAVLARPVDVMTCTSLHPYLRQRIEAEAIRVF